MGYTASSVKRIPQLDILRAAAVLMVIAYHYTPTATSRGGWVGVDLFFVLSGFLISGLLFEDIQQAGTISLKRFLIRRGFKIYPSFYFFLGVGWILNPTRYSNSYLTEIFFLQNYLGHAWGHTWSLAVEEHFYIVLPLILLILVHYKRLHTLPIIGGVLLLGCLVLRVIVACHHPDFHIATYPTHLRIDGLFFGVLLGYVFRFFPNIWSSLGRWWLLPIGMCLFLPSMLLDRNNLFILTAGLTLNTIGAGCLLVGTMSQPWFRAKSLEEIGRHSYSIYLWQQLVVAVFASSRLSYGHLALCMFLAVVLGITMATIVEMPTLSLRDRLFPVVRSETQTRSSMVKVTGLSTVAWVEKPTDVVL